MQVELVAVDVVGVAGGVDELFGERVGLSWGDEPANGESRVALLTRESIRRIGSHRRSLDSMPASRDRVTIYHNQH